MGFNIYATEHTAEALRDSGLTDLIILHKVRETQESPNILDYLLNKKIDLVINIPTANNNIHEKMHAQIFADEYLIWRLAVEFNIPVITNLELVLALIKSMRQLSNNAVTISSLNEYMDRLVCNIGKQTYDSSLSLKIR